MAHKTIQFQNKFIRTRNVRNFETLMDNIDLSAGEGRLGLVYARAGRGKSRTAIWWHAHHADSLYLQMATVWSELDLLSALAKELRIIDPPRRRGTAFAAVVDRLISNPMPVFLDEIEKLPRRHLDIVRDISDISTAPFVLIGEEELVSVMRQNRRVWSRTFEQMEFAAVDEAEIILYAGENTGMAIDREGAGLIRSESGGDFRLVKRAVVKLVSYCNATSAAAPTLDMIRTALKTGLSG